MAITLVGCGKPRIDATNHESLMRSLDTMRDALNHTDGDIFLAAWSEALGDAHIDEVLHGKHGQSEAAMAQFQGMTADEFVAAVHRISDSKKATARAKEIARRDELRARATSWHDDQQRLGRLQIRNIRFDDPSSAWTREKQTATFEVTNGLDVPLSSILADYKWRSPGRAIAWTDGEIILTFNGGLEPGETARVLATNVTGKLGPFNFGTLQVEMKNHPDGAFEWIIVEGLDADNASVVNAQPLSDPEKQELKRLEADLPTAPADRDPMQPRIGAR